MINRWKTALLGLFGSILLTGAAMQASAAEAVNFHLPSPTRVGETTLPAGNYNLHRVTSQDDALLLQIDSDQVHILVQAMRVQPPALARSFDRSSVILVHEAGETKLTEVRMEGLSFAYRIIQ